MKLAWSKGLALIPLAAAVLASILYVLQHGFWGGHGRFDSLIGLLTLPFSAIALTGISIPLPELLRRSDLILVIWLPTLVNSSLLFCVGWLIDRFRQRRA